MHSEYFKISLVDFNASQIGPFRIIKCLGEGSTGKVCLGEHIETKLQVAIKIIKKTFLSQQRNRWDVIEREIAILRLVDHPNILKFYDVLETPTKIYIILEYVKGGELFDYILAHKRLSAKESIRLLGQMVMGLEHCNKHGVCHRDLKPENLLLDEDKNIKIVDFGFAQVTRRWDEILLFTPCGSPHYTAPEIIAEENVYNGMQTDVWSFGIVLFAMNAGYLPFNHANIASLLDMVMEGIYKIPTFVAPSVADLITKMLVVNPLERIKMGQIRKHVAFEEMYPSMHDTSPDAVSPTSALEDSNEVIISPWICPEDLDLGIIQDLHALGWGNPEEIKFMLMEDNLEDRFFFRQRLTNPQIRVDRATYLLLKQRKIKRIQILRQLTTKAEQIKNDEILFSSSKRKTACSTIEDMAETKTSTPNGKKSKRSQSTGAEVRSKLRHTDEKTEHIEQLIEQKVKYQSPKQRMGKVDARFFEPTTPIFHRKRSGSLDKEFDPKNITPLRL